MASIFSSFFRLFSAQEEKPDHLENEKNPKGSNALPLRAQQTGQSITPKEIKGITERKSVSLPAVLGRIWATLKYRAELSKAASDCSKFLASLSGSNFELITAASLFGPLKHLEDGKFKELFEQTINETIVKFATKTHFPDLHAIKAKLDQNIAGFFDKPRQANYNNAYRIANQCAAALDLSIAGQAITVNWTIFEKGKADGNGD